MKHRSDAVHLGGFPSATGILTRLACRRAKEKGFDVEALLRDAGLTSQQIADPDARVDVKGQIRFLNHAAKKLNELASRFSTCSAVRASRLGVVLLRVSLF